MKFVHRYCTDLADGLELFKPGLQVRKGRDVLEAEVGERGAIVALCRR